MAKVGRLTKPNMPHKPVQVKCNLPSYFKLWMTTQSWHHPPLLSWLEAIQPEEQTSGLGFMSAGGCPGSLTNLLGNYLGTSLLLYLSEIFLRPINKNFWIRYHYIFLLSVVFVPYRLVRLHRKINQLSKPNLVWGIRTPLSVLTIMEEPCQAHASEELSALSSHLPFMFCDLTSSVSQFFTVLL